MYDHLLDWPDAQTKRTKKGLAVWDRWIVKWDAAEGWTRIGRQLNTALALWEARVHVERDRVAVEQEREERLQQGGHRFDIGRRNWNRRGRQRGREQDPGRMDLGHTPALASWTHLSARAHRHTRQVEWSPVRTIRTHLVTTPPRSHRAERGR